MEKVTVSIVCDVYNHEPYLRQCLDGFVMQKTDFPFEILIHDDASTDKSADIIREYASKYPDLFKPIYQSENQYSKGVGIWKDIQLPRANGKYIAFCEGDDYWTDPYKLQKQVDFLESHSDFSMCFHGAIIKNETKAEVITTCDKIQTKEYFTKDIFPGWVIPTASVVFRREMIESYPPLKHQEWMKYGDIVLFLKSMHTGRVWGMADQMSVYRMTSNGAVISQDKEKDLFVHMCNHYKFLMANFPQIDKDWIHNYIAVYYYSLIKHPKSISDFIKGIGNVLRYKPSYLLTKAFGKEDHVTKS